MSRSPLVRLGGTHGPRRILICAVSGSGKTSLAQRLSRVTGLPGHSVDDEIGFEPGARARWQNRPPDEQRTLAQDICGRDEWILDTAYAGWQDVVLARAELVVAMDYHRRVSLLRLFRRTAVRIVDRREVCNGNVETVRQVLSSDSIIAWHFRSFAVKRREIRSLLDDPAAPPTVCFTRPRDLEAWLDELEHPVV